MARPASPIPHALHTDQQFVVERWFRELTQKRLRRGVFRSVPELVQAISEYVAHHNTNPRGFQWTKKAADILEKVTRAKAALDKIPSA